MDAEIKVDGDDSFIFGMDGYTSPAKLPPGSYEMAMNIICRGGLAMTRPGSRSHMDLPEGKPQGVVLFKPTTGHPCLVFAISGNVYYSPQPFKEYHQIPGIKFYHWSKSIAWSVCTKSTDYDSEGNIVTLETPISVLLMQDGRTRAAYWDGSNGRHLNPTPSGTEFTRDGFDETPIGLWMVWSNNRLWLSRRNKVFASDIGNPLKFTEAQYINELRAFVLPGNCTGMAETPDKSGIIAFTVNTGDLIQSGIQDRTLWSSTPGFQKTIFTQLGCVSHRSIVQQYGLLWWWTTKGLISQDNALSAYRTSVLAIEDNEMIQSKANVSYDLSGVCGSIFENFTLHALPKGASDNTVVHVLDQGQQEGPTNVWPSYWTGWRPVEFARGVIGSQERVFCLSKDYDGVNRIWELFTTDKTDNGIPITSFLLTRQYFFGDREWKNFKYAEIELKGISGPTAVMVAVGGIKGAMQKVLTKDINSIKGQVYADRQYGYGSNDLFGSRPQTRIIRTVDRPAASDCNSEDVESEFRGLIDKAFSVLIVWSGIAGVAACRVFSQYKEQALQGVCEDDETDEERLLTTEGCGARSIFSANQPFDRYVSTAEFTRLHPDTDQEVSHIATQASFISQVDADRKASQTARWYVMSEIGEII